MKINLIKPSRPKGVTVVEVSERYFKIAQALSGPGGGRLTSLVWGQWDPTAFFESLQKLPAPPPFLIGSLPRSQGTTRHLILPSQNPKELGRMVALQMQRQIPFSKGKMVFVDGELYEPEERPAGPPGGGPPRPADSGGLKNEGQR